MSKINSTVNIMNDNNTYTLSYPSPEPSSPSTTTTTTTSKTYSKVPTLTPEPEHSTTMKLHTKPVLPKKQYQCPLCHKNFSRPSALQTHSYTHTAEKPFQCLSPGCGRRFSVVSNLRRHFKVHQKPAVSNKISSEDRLRCVRQLIKTSNLMLAEQRELEQANIKDLSNGTFSYSTTTTTTNEFDAMKRRDPNASSSMDLHELSSAAHRYQHYILLPAIQPTTSHHYGSHLDQSNNQNYLLGSNNNLCDIYLSTSHGRSSSMMDQQQQQLIPQQQPSYAYSNNNSIIASYSTNTSSLSTPIVSPTNSYLDNHQLPSYYSQMNDKHRDESYYP